MRIDREAGNEQLTSLLSFAGQFLESDRAGLVALDCDLRYIFWNAEMQRIWGMTSAEVLGKNAVEVFPFLEQIGETVYLKKALAGETVRSKGRRYVITPRGCDGYFDGIYTPLADEGGAIIGVVGIVRDCTMGKLAEEQLGETAARFVNMADAAPVLLWMADPDGLCTFFNQSWLDFTGHTLEEEWGVGWAEGIYFEDFQRCMDTYIAAFNARTVFEMEYRLHRHDGEYRWILDRGTPRYTPDGSFAGYIGSCIDITDRRRMESELRKAVRDRDEFLSIASHELRTPLTTLRLEIEGLKRALDKRAKSGHLPAQMNGRLEKSARVAENQTNRLITLVEELLDVSRLANGRLRVQPTEFDLRQLVDDVVRRLKPALEAARCRIEVDAQSETVGRWDRLRIEQVLSNLLSNALKYGAGGPVELSLTSENGSACVKVKDHGIGIGVQDHRRIFQRFERAVPMSEYGGFGLGLWIAGEVVAAHGGTIGVESAPGKGATFIVRLPLLRS